jgi:hypothetical protein
MEKRLTDGKKEGKSRDYTVKWRTFRQRWGDTNPETGLKI